MCVVRGHCVKQDGCVLSGVTVLNRVDVYLSEVSMLNKVDMCCRGSLC